MSNLEKAKSLIALLNADLPDTHQIVLDVEVTAFTIDIGGDEVVRFNSGDIQEQLIAFLTGLMWATRIPKKQMSPPRP